MNAEMQLHFDFESVRVCYFDIDLGMSSLSNKWEPLKSELGVIPYIFLSSSIALLLSLLSCSFFYLLGLKTISSVDILEMT